MVDSGQTALQHAGARHDRPTTRPASQTGAPAGASAPSGAGCQSRAGSQRHRLALVRRRGKQSLAGGAIIVSVERGLNSINRNLDDSESKTADHIREFLKQARAALSAGDMDGARTLAAKAKVLLDDLTK